MKRFYLFALAAFSIFLIGCGGGSSSTTTSGSGSNGSLSKSLPDFYLAVNDEAGQTLVFDSSGNATLTMKVRGNSFVASPIVLTLSNPLAGVSATFEPASVTASATPVSVKVSIHTNDPSKEMRVAISGKSGALERFESPLVGAYVAPSGFSIAITHVSTDTGALTRTYDVVLSQTSGTGEFALKVDRNNLSTTEFPFIPSSISLGTDFSGLPATYAFPAGESTKTFRLTVTLPQSTVTGIYGFGVAASRGGRTETASIGLNYTAGLLFGVSGATTTTGLTTKVDYTLTPRSANFTGVVVVNRGADGMLIDPDSGAFLTPLPSGTVVTGLPSNLAFDGTLASRTASFNVTLPSGTSTQFPFAVRIVSKLPDGTTTNESVLKLDFFTR